jgi:hypothetical protein
LKPGEEVADNVVEPELEELASSRLSGRGGGDAGLPVLKRNIVILSFYRTVLKILFSRKRVYEILKHHRHLRNKDCSLRIVHFFATVKREHCRPYHHEYMSWQEVTSVARETDAMEERAKKCKQWFEYQHFIHSYLETFGGHSSNLYLNVVHFLTPLLTRHLWELKIFSCIGVKYALLFSYVNTS